MRPTLGVDKVAVILGRITVNIAADGVVVRAVLVGREMGLGVLVRHGLLEDLGLLHSRLSGQSPDISKTVSDSRATSAVLNIVVTIKDLPTEETRRETRLRTRSAVSEAAVGAERDVDPRSVASEYVKPSQAGAQ